jgi:hypothetical protein
MWYECGCNGGCAEIGVPPDELKEGLQAQVLSGNRKGAIGYVAGQKDRLGRNVFILESNPPDPRGIEICRQGVRASALGYLCGTSDLGPLAADRCNQGCK